MADITKDSIARCGLICALCRDDCNCKTDNHCGKQLSPDGCFQATCSTEKGLNGCWECADAPCDKDMFTPIAPGLRSGRRKLRAFITCIREDGLEKFAQYIANNAHLGIVYHREGTFGDYDLNANDEILRLLRTGKARP